MKTSSTLLLVGALTLATGTALVARVLMKPPPPVTIIKEVEAPRRVSTLVLATRQPLNPGDFVDGAALEWVEIPDSDLRAGHIVAASNGDRRAPERSLYGATPRRSIAAHEPVSRDQFVQSGEPGFIAAVLAPGMRAVSIPTSAVASNAGLVSAGDWVDVILSLERDAAQPAASTNENPYAALAAQTILRRVRVLALNNSPAGIAPAAGIQQETAEKPARSTTTAARAHYETLTLEVGPEAAERLAVAKEIGTLQIALRGLNGNEPDSPHTVTEAAARNVTRLQDTTAIFRSGAGGSTPTVKVFLGSQQSTLSFTASH